MLADENKIALPLLGTLDQVFIISTQLSLNPHSVMLPQAGGERAWFGPNVMLGS